MQHYQAARLSKRSLVSQQPLEDPQRTKCTTTGGFASLTGPQDKELVPHPLGPTAAQIATFLYYLFDTQGLSPQSIKGYRSCLA